MRILLFILLMLQSFAYADEVVTDFSEGSVPVLNELLRTSNREIKSLESRIETLETAVPDPVSEILDADTTDVGNVGAGEDDLITYSMPANTFDNAGSVLRISFTGYGADNA